MDIEGTIHVIVNACAGSAEQTSFIDQLKQRINGPKRYRIKGHSALVVSAGTAASTRGRGEAKLIQCALSPASSDTQGSLDKLRLEREQIRRF